MWLRVIRYERYDIGTARVAKIFTILLYIICYRDYSCNKYYNKILYHISLYYIVRYCIICYIVLVKFRLF